MYSILATAHARLPPLRPMAAGEHSVLILSDIRDRSTERRCQYVESGFGPAERVNTRGADSQPVSGRTSGCSVRRNDLFAVDSGNHRVLSFPQQGSGFVYQRGSHTRSARLRLQLANLLEGREVGFSPNANSCLVNGAPGFSVRRPRLD